MKHNHANEVSAVEVKAAVERLGRAFEEFKSTNDAADTERKAKGYADSLVEDKLSRINDDLGKLQTGLDQIHLKAGRPGFGPGFGGGFGDDGANSMEAIEHKQAFYDRYIRKGLETNLSDLESKALNIGTDADGGYAVPEQLDGSIEKLLRDVSPIRRIANVVQIGNANYRKLVNISGAASGWVAETAARTETTSPQFTEVVPSLGELYANPAATQQMLDDAFFNVEEWLAEELSQEFAQQEGSAFVDGNGTNKPKGFLSYTTAATDDTARAFGTIEHVATGVSADFAASDPSDILVDLIYALRPVYRGAASFVMKGRKLYDPRKDSTNGGSGSHRYDDHSTWEWSENPALAIADYLIGVRIANSTTSSYDGQVVAGLGVAPARIDWVSIAAEANACDESVSLDAGGSENRYTCNGFIDSRRSHRDNLGQLASSMGGVVVFQSGKWSVYAAVAKTAVKSRDETDIIGGLNYVAKASRSEIANCVRGVYADAGSDHAPKDYPPIINATYVTEDGGDELWLDLDLPMTTSGTMAQRLSKIALERTRRQGRITASFQPVAFQDQAMDAILFSYAPFNLSSQKMLVLDWSMRIATDDNGNAGLVIQEMLTEEDDAIYSWTPATDEQAIPTAATADTPTRIADQRSIVPQSAGGVIVAVGTTPLSATDAGASATINIAAHTYQYGFGTVSVNAGSITGLGYSTKYYTYFDDLNREGGAVSYLATTSKTTVAAANGRTLVGEITTPAASDPDTGPDFGEGGILR